MSIYQAFRRAMLGLVAALVVAFLAGVAFVAYCGFTLPLSHAQGAETPSGALVFATDGGQVIGARGAFRGEPITADRLPRDLANAVVAIEDRRFYQHGGIDPRGILRAAFHNLRSRGTEGGSTITQQLARLTYLSPDRTLRRKVQEAMLAMWLEARLSKPEILARYLNAAYFGAGAYGADAAAKRYFGKKASELSLAESVMLAGLVRAPSQLAPTRNPEAAKRRADLVIEAMVEVGDIDPQRAAQLRAHPAALALPPEPEPGQNYFLDAAEGEVRRLVGSPPLDLRVTTTIDPRLQAAAEQVVEHWLAGEAARRQAGQAGLVAMAPDGAILAMVGGRDYGQSQFNRATQAHRQPGSLFKIFVYLTALSAGYTPDSVVVDKPVEIGDWQPKDYTGHYRGPVSLRTAFADSLNSVAVQLIQAVGVQPVIDLAKSLGVQSELPAVPSIALGSAEVTLLEMTRAMDAIAINSKSVDAYAIRSIANGAAGTAPPLYARPQTVRDPPPWNRTAMMRLLEAVVTEGTGKAARLDRRSAGKTGTTQDYRDAWFVGFTTEFVVGVWVGNDDNSPMDRVAGGDIPTRIWHDFVAEAEKIREKAAEQAATGSSAPTPGQRAGQPAAQQPGQEALLQPEASPAIGNPIGGVPAVVDTGTLLVNGATVRLSGLQGEKGDAVQDLTRYIGGRKVLCAPVQPGQYRCKIDDYDLGEAIVLNGAARAAADAPDRLRAAEAQARQAGRGLWRR